MEDDLKINALEKPYDEESFGIPPRWEPEHVGRRLVKAFVTLDRLPRTRGPREPGGHWPQHAVEWADRWPCDRMGRSLARAELSEAERRAREAAQNFTMLRPTSAEIAEMEYRLRLAARIARRRFRHGAGHEPLGTAHGATQIRAPALHREEMGAAHVLSQARQGARFSRASF